MNTCSNNIILNIVNYNRFCTNISDLKKDDITDALITIFSLYNYNILKQMPSRQILLGIHTLFYS